MKELVALTYKEIESDLLEKTLNKEGMVFVRLSSARAKAYIKLCERDNTIEKYKWSRPGWLKRQVNLMLAVFSLFKIFLFHMRLIELDSFRTINKVRCTWEIQPDGDYVLIFS